MRHGARRSYGYPLLQGGKTYFICFSSVEKFLAIFSLALTFSLVLSLVSRQEKEHSSKRAITSCFYCAIMIFVHFLLLAQKKTNQKKRAPDENGPDKRLSGTCRPPRREAILIYGCPYIADETPKIASSGIVKDLVEGGRDSIFARGFRTEVPTSTAGKTLLKKQKVLPLLYRGLPRGTQRQFLCPKDRSDALCAASVILCGKKSLLFLSKGSRPLSGHKLYF